MLEKYICHKILINILIKLVNELKLHILKIKFNLVFLIYSIIKYGIFYTWCIKMRKQIINLDVRCHLPYHSQFFIPTRNLQVLGLAVQRKHIKKKTKKISTIFEGVMRWNFVLGWQFFKIVRLSIHLSPK